MRLVVLTLACSALSSCGVLSESPAPRLKQQPLTVASDLSNPPFGELLRNGIPQGFEVDLCRELAMRLGRPLHYQRTSFEDLLPAVVAGEVDIACATLGITAERAQQVSFTRPYFETGIAVLVRNDESTPRSLEPLRTAAIAAARGTTSEQALLRQFPEATQILTGKGASGLDHLKQGTVLAVVMDAPDAIDLARAEPHRYRVLESHLAVENYAIAVNKKRTGLLEAINHALNSLESDGTLEKLRLRHKLTLSTVDVMSGQQ